LYDQKFVDGAKADGTIDSKAVTNKEDNAL
jgi:hypothetical protein